MEAEPDFSSHFTLTRGSAKDSQALASKHADKGKKHPRQPDGGNATSKRPRIAGEQKAARPKPATGVSSAAQRGAPAGKAPKAPKAPKARVVRPEHGVHSGTSGPAPTSAGRAASPAVPRAANPAPPQPGQPKLSWAFPVDYCDHFETDARAVQDIQPVLQQLSKRLRKPLSALVVYDPFYCAGGVRAHFAALGVTTFIHANRDFYADVAAGTLPAYDILVTNPPYSADHKERILEFCLRSGKPWCLLMPNYVATKLYFGQLQDAASTPPLQRPFFLTPRVRYSYDHPEGTGHTESPFASIWYIGLGAHTEAVFGSCRSRLDAAPAAAAGSAAPQGPASGSGAAGGGGTAGWDVALARSVEALRQAKAVPTAKRLNPQQRKRLRQKMQPG